ncbi:hypothetical protein D3C71_1779830 [compost metagenome]
MHAALGNHFAVEVGELFQVPDVLQQHRAARTGGHRVLIVGNGSAGDCGEFVHAWPFVSKIKQSLWSIIGANQSFAAPRAIASLQLHHRIF